MMMQTIANWDTEFSKRIVARCRSGDAEADHSRADGILVDFLNLIGMEKTAKAFEETERQYD